MSANPAISNVNVDYHNDDRIAIEWQTRTGRFHFWLYKGATEYTDQTLYKNSLVTRGDYHKPEPMGYFQTRKLDGTNAANAGMIKQVMAIVRSQDMITKAKAEHDAKQAADRAIIDAFEKRRTRAKEIFASMRMIMSGNALSYTLIRDDMDALLSYDPGNTEKTE